MSAAAPSRVAKHAIQPDPRLFGVWSRTHLEGVSAGNHDTRIIYLHDRTGRYETWDGGGLTEVVTFRWFTPAAARVTMQGCEYVYRKPPNILREPCDWNFPSVPFEIAFEQIQGGPEIPVLRLHFGGSRCDLFGLVTSNLTGWEDFHF
jgi:hypothetical protein